LVNLSNIIKDAEECNSKLQLYSICQNFITTCGYKYFCVLKQPEEYNYQISDLILLSNWPFSLIKSYDDAELFRNSPLSNNTKELTKPFLWNVKEMYDSHNEESEKIGTTLFQENHMLRGAGFKVNSQDDASGIILLTGDADLKNEESFEEIHKCANIIFGKILEFGLEKFKANEESKLSKREHECLLWTSEGKTSYEIGMILGLSENTINNYLVTVGRKLGAVNRPHMVGIALRKGFI